MNVQIKQWSEIAGDFQDTLLLGNGASVAVSRRFTYTSLKSAAESDGLITPNIRAVFDYLNTEDFELVMSVIWHAYHVNRALEVPDNATILAYNDVKKALIEVVKNHHTKYDEASSHLRPIASFMKRFKTVLSLNYDLIVYWAMMEGNERFGKWFKDCLIDGVLKDDWKKLREPHGQASGSTLVFYPHGNLMLARDLTGNEIKVKCQSNLSSHLLETVSKRWENGNEIPIFVSEGVTEQKRLAILRSHYLSTVYNSVMSDVGLSCAIYGWSANDSDSHILTKICKDAKRLAFSVYNEKHSLPEVSSYCCDIANKVRKVNSDIETLFFWFDSDDCWLNAKTQTPLAKFPSQ